MMRTVEVPPDSLVTDTLPAAMLSTSKSAALAFMIHEDMDR